MTSTLSSLSSLSLPWSDDDIFLGCVCAQVCVCGCVAAYVQFVAVVVIVVVVSNTAKVQCIYMRSLSMAFYSSFGCLARLADGTGRRPVGLSACRSVGSSAHWAVRH